MTNQQNQLPKDPKSYWIDSIDLQEFSALEQDIVTEVAIVGGGISGITTALLLAKEGMNVTLLESTRLLNGTTGHTTAKITAQHGILYDELISHFGLENTKLYYSANEKAAHFMENLIQEYGIDCDYQKESAYIISSSDSDRQKLENEAKAYEKLGIDGGFVDKTPLKFPTIGAVEMKNQAQFHPLKYLAHLVGELKTMGVQIFERSTAVRMEQGDPAVIHMRNGNRVKAKYVVSASHFPFHDGKGYFARLYPKRSYVIAVKQTEAYPGGMYITSDKPTRSFRSVKINGEDMLLVIGESNKTGQGIPEIEHYEALVKDAVNYFNAKEVLFRWSAQDLVTPDKVPYIGRISKNHRNVFVATGFRKWGMAHGTFSGMLISDLILEKDNPYEEFYAPSRFPLDPSVKTFVKENMNVAAQLIGGKLDRPDKEIKDIQENEGAVITIKGKRAGAYRDSSGNLFVVDTTCTHMGCEVNWNSGDRTWDCPCHGSRFAYHGEVVEGPADQPLKRIDPNQIDFSSST
ncbi:FAD-dependent oxidoreductase [Siminovitchia sediminis]|uniref:FAD-dependent oxidoreductase n=1 Tax=Siminovitchia sediminis TaxID=1274353 RepID=A0ABW4KGS4_9BACI